MRGTRGCGRPSALPSLPITCQALGRGPSSFPWCGCSFHHATVREEGARPLVWDPAGTHTPRSRRHTSAGKGRWLLAWKGAGAQGNERRSAPPGFPRFRSKAEECLTLTTSRCAYLAARGRDISEGTQDQRYQMGCKYLLCTLDRGGSGRVLSVSWGLSLLLSLPASPWLFFLPCCRCNAATCSNLNGGC